MACIGHYLKRSIRVALDLFVQVIGFLYPSQTNYLPPINDRLLLEPAVVLVKRIKSGELSAEQLVRTYIARIKEVQPYINAVVDERYEEAILEAQEVDKRVKHELSGNEPLDGVSIHSQPLLGIPFSGKDSQAIKGLIISSGSAKRKHLKAEEDATAVRRMREAGAIPVCMTNVPEMLMWWYAYNKTFGQTYNPYDKSVIPGGSTGGNASLIASAGSVIGMASDIGGSIRIPAFFCGVFGHCITPGLVPIDGRWPTYPEERYKMVNLGPMARYASDLRTVTKVLVGPNESKLRLDENVDFTRLKVFYMYEINDPLLTSVSHETRNGIANCVQHLQSLGADVKEVNIEKFENSFLIWQTSMRCQGVTPFAEELTNRNGRINPFLELLKSLYGGSEHTIHALCTAIFDSKSPSQEVLQKGQQLREELKNELHQMLGNDSVLLFPSHPDSCVKVNATLFNFKNICYTAVFNALNLTMTQMPIGLSNKGLPLGLQVIATPFNDHLTISVAEELEKKFGGWAPPTTITAN